MALLGEFRTLDRRVFILTAARLVVTFGFSMVIPFLAFYLSKQRAVAAVAVGLIWTVAGAAGAAAQWVGGALTDRWGRRPVILTSMFVRAGNLALLGLAVDRQAPIVVIGALIVANSVLRAFFDPVAAAMVADLSTGDQRVAAFSLQRIGVNVGWAAGPAVTGVVLAAGGSYPALFYWSAPVTLIAAIAIARIKETRAPAAEPAATRPRFVELFHIPADPAFLRFLAATFCFFLLQAQLYQTLSFFAARTLHLTEAQVPTLYFLNGLMVVALQVPAFYFIRRIGTRQALVMGSLLYAASYASCGLAHSHASLLVCVALITLAEMVSAPAQQTAATGMAPAGRIGAYAGLFGLSQAAGQSLAPLVGGWLFDRYGDHRIWALLPIFGVLAAIGYRGGVRTAPIAPPVQSSSLES